jgi:AcrR family transcriptional regulator
MADKKQSIINFTLKRFMESGYSGVLMDDIARGCGISKATLYSFFSSKELLISECIDNVIEDISQQIIANMTNPSFSYMDKLDRIFVPVSEFLSHINSAVLDNLRRNFPEAYEKIDSSRRKLILLNISTMVEEGKKLGYLLPDTDPKLIAHMFIGIAAHVIDPDILVEFGQTADRIMLSAIPVIIRGCLTEEGRKLYLENSEDIKRSPF